jgi:hypothetical protein
MLLGEKKRDGNDARVLKPVGASKGIYVDPRALANAQ